MRDDTRKYKQTMKYGTACFCLSSTTAFSSNMALHYRCHLRRRRHRRRRRRRRGQLHQRRRRRHQARRDELHPRRL